MSTVGVPSLLVPLNLWREEIVLVGWQTAATPIAKEDGVIRVGPPICQEKGDGHSWSEIWTGEREFAILVELCKIVNFKSFLTFQKKGRFIVKPNIFSRAGVGEGVSFTFRWLWEFCCSREWCPCAQPIHEQVNPCPVVCHWIILIVFWAQWPGGSLQC